MAKLTDGSTITFSLLGAVVVVTLWVSNIRSTGLQNAEAIIKAEAKADVAAAVVQAIREDMITIKNGQQSMHDLLTGLDKKVTNLDERLTLRYKKEEEAF